MSNQNQSLNILKADGGGANEQSYITPSEMGGTGEVQTITVPATAAAAQGDYFVLEDPEGTTLAVWLDIDADGTAPTGAAYVASDSQAEVNIVTGGTAAQNGALVATALESTGAFSSVVDNEDGTVTVTFLKRGDAGAPTRHNTGDTGNGSFSVATDTAGTAPTVQGKYFLFSSDADDFYGWFSCSGNGSDPAVADRTGVEIDLGGDETNAEYLAYIVSKIDGTTGMSAELDGSRIVVQVDANGSAADVGAGDSGFTVESRSQGYAAQFPTAASSPASISINPSVLS
jgi:hypothetical protein